MAPKAKKEDAPKKADEAKKADAAKEPGSGTDVKPQKPDEAAFQKRLDVVKEKIDKLKAAQEKLTGEINSKNTGKEAYESERQVLYDELSQVKSEKEEKMSQLKGLKDSEQERRREEKDTKHKMGKLEKDLSSEDDIDKKIQQIEMKMSTTTMSLKEEKEFMNQIKKLKAGRPEIVRKVKEYEAMKAKVSLALRRPLSPSRSRSTFCKRNSAKKLKSTTRSMVRSRHSRRRGASRWAMLLN